jgi:Na+-driven multidrug efflux pump
MLAAVFHLKPMLNLFGVTEAILPYAEPYVRIISLGIPLGIFATGASYHIRADGSPGYASATILAGVIFNMVFDPIFLAAREVRGLTKLQQEQTEGREKG